MLEVLVQAIFVFSLLAGKYQELCAGCIGRKATGYLITGKNFNLLSKSEINKLYLRLLSKLLAHD